jgi:hypothetical protein
MRLRPVTYRYKQAYQDGSKPIDHGLIAEEVAELYPDLVARNRDGQIQTVPYQKLTPMLLNRSTKAECRVGGGAANIQIPAGSKEPTGRVSQSHRCPSILIHTPILAFCR